jgi:hypothetical protein
MACTRLCFAARAAASHVVSGEQRFIKIKIIMCLRTHGLQKKKQEWLGIFQRNNAFLCFYYVAFLPY